MSLMGDAEAGGAGLASAMRHAATKYTETVISRREALLRQLHLHVHAYAKEEAGGRSIAAATAQGSAPTPRAAREAVRRSTSPFRTPDALQTSLHRLAQQLRRESVRVIEAIQIVRLAQFEDDSKRGTPGVDGGGGSDTGGTAQTRRAPSSSGGSPSKPSDNGLVFESYLDKMMHDTDMISISPTLCKSLDMDSREGRANPLLLRANLLSPVPHMPNPLPPVMAWLVQRLVDRDIRELSGMTQDAKAAAAPTQSSSSSSSGARGTSGGRARKLAPTLSRPGSHKAPQAEAGLPRHMFGAVASDPALVSITLVNVLSLDRTVAPDSSETASTERVLSPKDAEMMLRLKHIYTLVEYVRLSTANAFLAGVMEGKLREDRQRKAALERATSTSPTTRHMFDMQSATFLTAPPVSPPGSASSRRNSGTSVVGMGSGPGSPSVPPIAIDARGGVKISREWTNVLHAAEDASALLGITPTVHAYGSGAVKEGGGGRGTAVLSGTSPCDDTLPGTGQQPQLRRVAPGDRRGLPAGSLLHSTNMAGTGTSGQAQLPPKGGANSMHSRSLPPLRKGGAGGPTATSTVSGRVALDTAQLRGIAAGGSRMATTSNTAAAALQQQQLSRGRVGGGAGGNRATSQPPKPARTAGTFRPLPARSHQQQGGRTGGAFSTAAQPVTTNTSTHAGTGASSRNPRWATAVTREKGASLTHTATRQGASDATKLPPLSLASRTNPSAAPASGANLRGGLTSGPRQSMGAGGSKGLQATKTVSGCKVYGATPRPANNTLLPPLAARPTLEVTASSSKGGRSGLPNPRNHATVRSPAKLRDLTMSSSPSQAARSLKQPTHALASPYAAIISPTKAAAALRVSLAAGRVPSSAMFTAPPPRAAFGATAGSASSNTSPVAARDTLAASSSMAFASSYGPHTFAAPLEGAMARDLALRARVDAAAASASAIISKAFLPQPAQQQQQGHYMPLHAAAGIGPLGSYASAGNVSTVGGVWASTGPSGVFQPGSIQAFNSSIFEERRSAMPTPSSAAFPFMSGPSFPHPTLSTASMGDGALLGMPPMPPRSAAVLKTSVSDFMTRLETIKSSIFQRMGIHAEATAGSSGENGGLGSAHETHRVA